MATAIKRDILKIDATDRSIGRIASQAAMALQGKTKPQFERHVDLGDTVEIRNAAKVKIIGNKLVNKKYFHYSGYPGGMKERQLKDIMAKDPADAIRRAVNNMLPKNRLRVGRMKRLKVHND